MRKINKTTTSLIAVKELKQRTGFPSGDTIHPDLWMTLSYEPASKDAIALTKALSLEVSAYAGRKYQPTKPMMATVGAAVADLLSAAASARDRYCFRSMGANTFGDGYVKYGPFKTAIEAFQAGEYIELVKAHSYETAGTTVIAATTMRATRKLIDCADSYGVRLDDLHTHFRRMPRPASAKAPIAKKTSSRNFRGEKVDGKPMPVDLLDPKVAALAKQVNDINGVMAKQFMEPDRHIILRRVFNQGDLPSFNWDKGGRLISPGVDSYQQMPSERKKPGELIRADIRLNGEATVEIDIRASHLTILRAKLGIVFDAEQDPYVGFGLDRFIVKTWVTMTLGHDKFHRAWSVKAKKKYQQKFNGQSLQDDFPIAKTRATILEALPFLRNWESSPIRWGDLQFIESEIIVNSVWRLAVEHSIAAFPVHDSLIVQVSHRKTAERILAEEFSRAVGVRPGLSTK